jgi:hypothetical protein
MHFIDPSTRPRDGETVSGTLPVEEREHDPWVRSPPVGLYLQEPEAQVIARLVERFDNQSVMGLGPERGALKAKGNPTS